jgi:hypothetical protein
LRTAPHPTRGSPTEMPGPDDPVSGDGNGLPAPSGTMSTGRQRCEWLLPLCACGLSQTRLYRVRAASVDSSPRLRPAKTDPPRGLRMRILRNIHEHLSQADGDELERRLKEAAEEGEGRPVTRAGVSGPLIRPRIAHRDYRVTWTDFRQGQPCPQRHMVNLRIVAPGSAHLRGERQ